MQDHIERFLAREKPPRSEDKVKPSLDAVPDFQNGRELRDYQVCYSLQSLSSSSLLCKDRMCPMCEALIPCDYALRAL